jgi:hypothetical protein
MKRGSNVKQIVFVNVRCKVPLPVASRVRFLASGSRMTVPDVYVYLIKAGLTTVTQDQEVNGLRPIAVDTGLQHALGDYKSGSKIRGG